VSGQNGRRKPETGHHAAHGEHGACTAQQGYRVIVREAKESLRTKIKLIFLCGFSTKPLNMISLSADACRYAPTTCSASAQHSEVRAHPVFVSASARPFRLVCHDSFMCET